VSVCMKETGMNEWRKDDEMLSTRRKDGSLCIHRCY